MRAWVINLDAENEVEGARHYHGPYAALAARPELEARLAGLVPEGDVVLRCRADALALGARGEKVEGVAWSMTPSAARELELAGAAPSFVPGATLLRTITSRAFSAHLGLALEGASFITNEAELEPALAALPRPILARRAFGFAGRGRRLFTTPLLTEADRTFSAKALREGGLLLEPFVDRLGDYSLHGFIAEGELALGSPTCVDVDRTGVWRGSRLALEGELTEEERHRLEQEARRAGGALGAAGYRGPFGIDAYRYRGGSGRTRFNPRCEINPRYSMGYAIGMGSVRPDLLSS